MINRKYSFKLILLIVLVVLLIIILEVRQLGWNRTELLQLTLSEQQTVIDAYGISVSDNAQITEFVKVDYIDDVFYVIKIDNIDDMNQFKDDNATWSFEQFDDKFMILNNKRFSQQRIYICNDASVYVSCFEENIPNVEDVFFQLLDSKCEI